MKSSYKIALVLVGIAVLAFGWAAYKTYYADTPARRLMSYINGNLSEVRKLDRKADRLWVETNRKIGNPEVFADGLEDDVIPAFEELLAAVEANAPEDAQLKKIHDIYHEAVLLQLEGYDQWLEGLRTKDNRLIVAGKADRNKGWTLTLRFRGELRKIAAENDVLID